MYCLDEIVAAYETAPLTILDSSCIKSLVKDISVVWDG